MTTVVPCPEAHAWLDVADTSRNFQLDYDGSPTPMLCKADPLRRLADAVNRCLGRYPAPRMMMAWPYKSPTLAGCETNGSAPLINWATPDYIRNARSGQVRIVSALRSDNAANIDHGGSYACMGHNFAENTPVTTAWAPDLVTNYPRHTTDHIIYTHRGAESNSVREYSLNTYGGYQVLDILHLDDEKASIVTNAAVWDYCTPAAAATGKEILADLAEQIRSTFHRLRAGTKMFQTSWLSYCNSNALQYPTETDERGIVVTSNTAVNLINQSWTLRNSDSPGVECHGHYSGRGHTGVASGTVVPCTVRILAEYNTAGPPGNASINVVGPVDWNWVNVLSNTGATSGRAYYAVNVALNTLLDPRNVVNGVNKLDLFGWVANSGTDSLIVRGIYVTSDYN